MSPNQQGITTLQIIKLLENYDFTKIDSNPTNRVKILLYVEIGPR